jgi:hypothetical protein
MHDINVVELRRYALRPGARARFSRYFDTWFPEAFQQLGAAALGQFHERGAPDRFTWLRGFADMAARRRACTAFYDGPVWAEHRAALNELMVDSDNVLLLQPARPGDGLRLLPAVDPVREPGGARGIVVAQLFPVAAPLRPAFLSLAERCFAAYRGRGLAEAGVLASLDEANNFPRHPVRTDSFVVWLGVLRDEAALGELRPALDLAARTLATSGLLTAPPELVLLDPTPRSRLRWPAVAALLARAA